MDDYRRETIAYTMAKLAEAIGDSNRDATRLLTTLKRQVLGKEVRSPPVVPVRPFRWNKT